MTSILSENTQDFCSRTLSVPGSERFSTHQGHQGRSGARSSMPPGEGGGADSTSNPMDNYGLTYGVLIGSFDLKGGQSETPKRY